MSQLWIRHHWESQIPISEYVPLPSYFLLKVLPIPISSHLIYLRFLLRNPLKAQCTYRVECCYIDPQLEFAKSWETLHLYIKQFGCCSSHSTKALLSWAGSTNKRLTDTFENRYTGKCIWIEEILLLNMKHLPCSDLKLSGFGRQIYAWIYYSWPKVLFQGPLKCRNIQISD